MKRNIFLYLMIGFTTTLVIMVIFSLISFQRMNSMMRYSSQVEHTYKVMGHLSGIGNTITSIESSMRGFVITKDSTYILTRDSLKHRYNQHLEQLRQLIEDDSQQKIRLAMIRSTVQLRLQLLESMDIYVDMDANRPEILKRVAKGRELMTSFREILNLMQKEEEELLKKRFEQKERFKQLTSQGFRAVAAIVGIIFLAFFVLLVKAILDRFKFQQELQEQLLSLKQSNDELTQLAFAASHDLQEPVRKIRTFTDRLRLRQQDRLDEEGQMILSRIDASGKRLQDMLIDISTYMNLLESESTTTRVSLKNLWEEIIAEEAVRIHKLKATVVVGNMPVLEVYPEQIRKMFRALLENALSYNKEDVSPIITITHREVDQKEIDVKGLPNLQQHYHAITIEDNGIGFDNEYKVKIFQLFRRLHTQEDRSGKGIGLAICQRVMANHNGVIDAYGDVTKGAAFTLYFPKD